MPVIVTHKQVRKETFIRGKIISKFRGDQRFNGNLDIWEDRYQIKLYETEIQAYKEHIVKSPQAESISLPKGFDVTQLIEGHCILNLAENRFKIELKEAVILEAKFSKHLIEEDYVFGVVEGEVYCKVEHYETIEVHQEVPEVSQSTPHSNRTDIDSIKADSESEYLLDRKLKPLGKRKRKGVFRVIADIVFMILGLLFLAVLVITGIIALINAFRFLLPALIFYFVFWLGSWLVSYFPSLFRGVYLVCRAALRGLIWMVLVSLVVSVLYGLLNGRSSNTSPRVNPIEDFRIPEYPEDLVADDAFYSRNWEWLDYRGRELNISYQVTGKAYSNSRNSRLGTSSFITQADYRKATSIWEKNQREGLISIRNQFIKLADSLDLSETEKAEAVLSFVQSIPYTLILDNECDYRKYSSEFIREYLLSGGACFGNVKHGMFTPIEFSVNYRGDCDTRTFFAFTMLNSLGYDVVMLNSEIYSHSILGIALPYHGASYSVDGVNYYYCELTSPDSRPGEIEYEISNPSYWDVNLISE